MPRDQRWVAFRVAFAVAYLAGVLWVGYSAAGEEWGGGFPLVVFGGSFLAGVVVSKPALILPPLGFGAVFVGGVEELFDVTNDAWAPAVLSGVIFSEAVAGFGVAVGLLLRHEWRRGSAASSRSLDG